MKEQIGFYSSLLFSLLFCLLLYDCMLWLAGSMHQIPASHKQIMQIGILFWFVLLISGRNRDDDPAGQV